MLTKRNYKLSALAAAALSLPAIAGAAVVTVLTSKDPRLVWKTVTPPGGKQATYTHGIGSGAFRHRSDPTDVV